MTKAVKEKGDADGMPTLVISAKIEEEVKSCYVDN